MSISSDGRYLAAPVDEPARVWDATTGRTVLVARGHDGLVLSAAFAPDGRSLGGQDLTATLGDAQQAAASRCGMAAT